jgi:hypothetical protein
MENKTGKIDVTPNFLLYSTNFAICCTFAFYSIMQADPMLVPMFQRPSKCA